MGDGERSEPKRVAEGVFDEVFARLAWLMRTKYVSVLEANRRFEEETGYANKIGAFNLADALSHIGTIFEQAPKLTLEQQRAQVTLIEDHLRRSMMEAWEQMHNFQVGQLDKLEQEHYLTKVQPLLESGEFFGAPSTADLDKLRLAYTDRLHRARATKREVDWDEWQRGTDLLIEACELASELRRQMEASIAAAEQFRRDRDDREASARRHAETMRRDTANRRVAIAAAVSAVVVAIVLFGADLVFHDDPAGRPAKAEDAPAASAGTPSNSTITTSPKGP